MPVITIMAIDVIQDRESKLKQTAISMGLSPTAYWGGTFVTHYMISLLISVSLPILMHFFPMEAITGAGKLLITIEAFVYPICLLGGAYCLSLCFATRELALKMIPLCNLVLCMGTSIAVFSLFMMPGKEYIAKVMNIVFSFTVPSYGLPGTMICLMFEHGILGGNAERTMGDIMSGQAKWPFIGCFVQPVWMALILVLAEKNYFSRLRKCRKSVQDVDSPGACVEGDEDVRKEEELVRSGAEGPIVLDDVQHSYVSKEGVTHAVKGISLMIPKGQCFGLLGPNGAGKTTTLSILTGELYPHTGGVARVLGLPTSSLYQVSQHCGYCPQFDALWFKNTGRDNLIFYAMVKGIPASNAKDWVDAWLVHVGLDQDADKKVETYSGGMKRKLSIACCMIGSPDVMFLDEPSAGVDAQGKRQLWDIVRQRRPDQTAILTTHSMEEADALCDRLAIQVNGRLNCLGTPMHIKNKYGSGYRLEMVVPNASKGEVTQFVEEKISPQCKLLESECGFYVFQMPPTDAKFTLGFIFNTIAAAKISMGIEDYSISQPTLEQVFLYFAKRQTDDTDAMSDTEE